MASGVFLVSIFFSALPSLPWVRNGGVKAQDTWLGQPQAYLSVLIGENLRLECRVPDKLPAGGVKWYLGEGPQRKLIYSDKQTPENDKRIKRNSQSSDTDFTIVIHNVTLEDAGTYYCVKEKKNTGQSEDWLKGRGTVVTVRASRSTSVTPVAVGVSLLILVGLFCSALCFYLKKKRGLQSSNSRPETSFPQKPQSSKLTSGDKEIVYADLKGPSGSQLPGKINLEERSVYATIKGTPAGATEKGPFSA